MALMQQFDGGERWHGSGTIDRERSTETGEIMRGDWMDEARRFEDTDLAALRKAERAIEQQEFAAKEANSALRYRDRFGRWPELLSVRARQVLITLGYIP